MPKATDPINEHYAYHDDPIQVQPSQGKKAPSAFFALLLLAVAATYFIQTTLASNISINSGARIEFGQGSLSTVACSGATALTITPHSTFTNASPDGAFYFDSFSVSGIPDTCFGSDFTINGYQNSSDTPLALYNTTSTTPVIYDNAGTFEAGIGGTGLSVSGSSGTFTVVFSVPVALSTSLLKLTIQSSAHSIDPLGITWTSRTSAADNGWRSITYGNGIFVAVSSSGTGNRVMTSPDGITWTSRTSAADNYWYGITYGNGIFVAVSSSGNGNRVMTSTS